MNAIVAVLFTVGTVMWAEADRPWLAALYGVVAGLWWAATIEEVVNG